MDFFTICKHDENVGYGGEQTKINHRHRLTQINADDKEQQKQSNNSKMGENERRVLC